MKIFYSEKHLNHAPQRELAPGYFDQYYEKPERASYILEAVSARQLGEVIKPDEWDTAPILRVHDAGYIRFLQTAHQEWQEAGYESKETFGFSFNVQHPGARPPTCIEGKLGYYTSDGTVPLTATSWEAIQSSAWSALSAQREIATGAANAFALCRPPGHHATSAAASGYCFVNNAAVAAQALLDGGVGKVSLLDVDYHHGNGTQAIFYDRSDVQFLSIHADPADEYPYFLGYDDETGAGAGEGFTHNYALPKGTDFSRFREALKASINRINDYGPDILIVSLGVDTYKDDPISGFLLDSPDYLKIGALLAAIKKPTLFVMEGGYAVEEIGINVANTLKGFLDNA